MLVLKSGCYRQRSERPQRKNLEMYPAPGGLMFILVEWKMRDTNYLRVINLRTEGDRQINFRRAFLFAHSIWIFLMAILMF